MINYFANFQFSLTQWSLWVRPKVHTGQHRLFSIGKENKSQETTIRQNQAFPKTYSQSPKNAAQQAHETAGLSYHDAF